MFVPVCSRPVFSQVFPFPAPVCTDYIIPDAELETFQAVPGGFEGRRRERHNAFFLSPQSCRSRTARRPSSTAGGAVPPGCGQTCGRSSSTPPTSHRYRRRSRDVTSAESEAAGSVGGPADVARAAAAVPRFSRQLAVWFGLRKAPVAVYL